MNDSINDRGLLAAWWAELAAPASSLDAVTFEGHARPLGSAYEVSTLASASVAAATLGVAEFHALRRATRLPAVTIDREHVAAAFASERLLSAVGWQLPAVWDPLAGDYACGDGFIRLHTNYTYHRDAVLRVLGVAADRRRVKDAVAGWRGGALESAVVAAGGCAAFMRSPAAWRAHPQGRALASEALFTSEHVACAAFSDLPEQPSAPLAGVRVLDLTRVIAGPICTRFLAAYGADVLRIDPPGFAEVGALLCDITAGKRCAALDLEQAPDRQQFEQLVAAAHLIVHGYRSDALSGLGYDNARLRALSPNASIICHDAYGWSGPWAARRGFDSLVQMSCGIAYRGRQVLGGDKPQPLPVQALDHATGYLLAASACRALTRRASAQQASVVRLSLARTACALMELGDDGDPQASTVAPSHNDPWLEAVDTHFGPVRRVRCPGRIAGIAPHWSLPAGPLGVSAAAW